MPRTQIERVWLFGAALVAFLLLLVGYLMFISPQNSKTSTANSQVSAANAVNQRFEARISSLRDQSKNLPKYQAELQAAQLALPSTSGLPDFLRTLQSLGNATLTTVSSLTVGPPTDVTTAASGRSTTATVAPGGLHVYALPISAQVSGSVSALDQFLTQLQTVQPRAVLISQLTEATGGSTAAAGTRTSGGAEPALQLTMQAFVAPSSAAEQARLSSAAGK
jgi:hypothetical protein